MILQPISAKPDLKRDIVRLSFDIIPPVEMVMRAAIAWPLEGIWGIAVVAGWGIQSHEITIFEDYPFITVEPIFIKSANKDVGLQIFLKDIWVKFCCNKIFYAADTELHQIYSRQIYRDEMLRPVRIQFIKVPYTDEKIADNLMRTRVHQETIRWPTGCNLETSVPNPESRGRHVIRTLIAGFEYLPWRDWSKPEELKEIYL